jgi:hypothetical protein
MIHPPLAPSADDGSSSPPGSANDFTRGSAPAGGSPREVHETNDRRTQQPHRPDRYDAYHLDYGRPLYRESLQGSATAGAEFVATSTPEPTKSAFYEADRGGSGSFGDKYSSSTKYGRDGGDQRSAERSNHGEDYDDQRGNEIESHSAEDEGLFSKVSYSSEQNEPRREADYYGAIAGEVAGNGIDEVDANYDEVSELDETKIPAQYPVYGSIPATNFNCSHQLYKGPFADIETGCQVSEKQKKMKFGRGCSFFS